MAETCSASATGLARHPSVIVPILGTVSFTFVTYFTIGLSLAVPEQVSVVGFDGAAPGQWDAYGLTTVRQPIRSMVKAAVDMLIARIDEPSTATEKRMFSGELIEGRSARLR